MAPAIPLDFRNVNTLWASVLVETLFRSGVHYAMVSPGSRSTPLAIALARHGGIKAVPVLDERSAAFFALGRAKLSGRPVVLVCTSGTATANYFPAVIEAHESGVPLIVLTADRPPEMRACASGQTIDQQKIYGGYVSYYHELALPGLSEPLLRYLRQMVLHAFQHARQSPSGPVHLNVPFHDPLAPQPDGGETEKFSGAIDWEQFFSHLSFDSIEVQRLATGPVLLRDVHGVIVAGPEHNADSPGRAEAVGELARKLGWPVLADALGPWRNHGEIVPYLVTTYDIVLRNSIAAERLKPEIAICVGGWPASKTLRAWLEASAAGIWLMTDRMDNRDALHGRTRHCALSLQFLAAQLPELADANGYQLMWASFERRARPSLDARLNSATELFEGKAAWLLAQHLPAETPLSIANSMPIRDMEYFWPANARRIRPFFNRGANGIDGTLSTALGVAHDAGRPAVLLTGDLALLHDTNGFLLRPKLRGSLTVVLINNRGGGIFQHLPIAQFDPPFEEFFATPQEVDFAKLCGAYGVEHVLVRDWMHFTELVSNLPASGIRVLEIRTDRKRDAATRKQIFAEVAAGLG